MTYAAAALRFRNCPIGRRCQRQLSLCRGVAQRGGMFFHFATKSGIISLATTGDRSNGAELVPARVGAHA